MDVKNVYDKLKEVIDPELGFNIVDLGQVEEINIEGDRIFVKYLPTTPFCPYLGLIVEMIENKIRELGYKPEVEVDFNTQWTPDRMKKELRDKFGL